MPFTNRDAARHFESLQTKSGIRKVVAEMRKLDDAGRAIMLRAISEEMTQAKKEKTLALLTSQVSETDKHIHLMLADAITESYVIGVNLVHRQLRQIRFKPVAGAPTLRNITPVILSTSPDMKPHLQAVNALLSGAYLDFGNTMRGYIQGAERILNETLKQQIRSNIAVERLKGTSIYDIKKLVRKEFEDRGFTVLLDRGGRQWTLDHYSEMLARTHTMRANNEAVINRAADFGVDIVEVKGTDPCTMCQEYIGKVFSISGQSNEYPKLMEEPPFHPRCRCGLLLRPDLK